MKISFSQILINAEDRGQMAERLDRFTWVNILQESFKWNQDEAVSELANILSEIPQGWWIDSSLSLEKAWIAFRKAVQYVISVHRLHKDAVWWRFYSLVWKIPPNHSIEGYESSVLAAHQAAHDLASHGGSQWISFLSNSYEESGVKKCWLEDIAFL